MSYEIKNYNSDFIEKQVDLIWEVTGEWKYPFGTSYESVKRQYSADNFDSSTRFYSFKNDELVGYITSAVTKDEEKGDYASLRFPIVKGNDPEITEVLYQKAEERIRELAITRIRAPAGVGMGNTIEMAKKFGFEKESKFFIRSILPIDQIKVSGTSENVMDFAKNSHEAVVREIFVKKMGIPEPQSEGFFTRSLANKERKENIAPHRTSWKIKQEDEKIIGFSQLSRSDQNPERGQMSPAWIEEGTDGSSIIDNLLSAHINSLRPHGLKSIGTFLPSRYYHMEELYNKFGFHYDPTYIYEKQL